MSPVNISDTVDMILNGEVINRRYAYVMVVCEARGDYVGGETRILSNIDELAMHTLLNQAVNELNSKMGNA